MVSGLYFEIHQRNKVSFQSGERDTWNKLGHELIIVETEWYGHGSSLFHTLHFYICLRIFQKKLKHKYITGRKSRMTSQHQILKPWSVLLSRWGLHWVWYLRLRLPAEAQYYGQAWGGVWKSPYHRRDTYAHGLGFAASASEGISSPTKSGAAHAHSLPTWQLKLEVECECLCLLEDRVKLPG